MRLEWIKEWATDCSLFRELELEVNEGYLSAARVLIVYMIIKQFVNHRVTFFDIEEDLVCKLTGLVNF